MMHAVRGRHNAEKRIEAGRKAVTARRAKAKVAATKVPKET